MDYVEGEEAQAKKLAYFLEDCDEYRGYSMCSSDCASGSTTRSARDYAPA
jgi:hypothetical protein